MVSMLMAVMSAARRFPILSLNSIIFSLILMTTTLVFAACQNGRATRMIEGDALPTSTQDVAQQVAPTSPLHSQEERDMAVNRIAYVGSDGNLFTINPDGTDPRKLTTTDTTVGPAGHFSTQGTQNQDFYSWPTWSPDSTKLAVSRVTIAGDSFSLSLEVVDTSNNAVTNIYDNEPNTIPIAQGAPHYTYWSPDGKQLTFLASTQMELSLFVRSLEDRGEPVPLVGQAPIYFNWAGDSSAILIHSADQLLLVRPGVKGSQPIEPLGTVGLGFRAPALSREATKMVYLAEGAGGYTLYLADTLPGLERATPILDVGPGSAFLWSPIRDEVAVAEASSITAAGPVYERLIIITSDGVSQRVAISEPFLAFFWSPDGEKLAYFALEQETQAFSWKYIDRSGGNPVELVQFLPSADYATVISFFDQYSYSNSVWSPDSRSLVFSGTLNSGAQSRNGGSPEIDRVYVIDVKEGSIPREIATSRFAVWSWR